MTSEAERDRRLSEIRREVETMGCVISLLTVRDVRQAVAQYAQDAGETCNMEDGEAAELLLTNRDALQALMDEAGAEGLDLRVERVLGS